MRSSHSGSVYYRVDRTVGTQWARLPGRGGNPLVLGTFYRTIKRGGDILDARRVYVCVGRGYSEGADLIHAGCITTRQFGGRELI